MYIKMYIHIYVVITDLPFKIILDDITVYTGQFQLIILENLKTIVFNCFHYTLYLHVTKEQEIPIL